MRKYDRIAARSAEELRLAAPDGALDELAPGVEEALERAIVAVERYHRPQVHEGYRTKDSGVELTERRTPLRRVGIYVPGGRAAYPSTAVMTVVPARLAGVGVSVVQRVDAETKAAGAKT